MKSKLFDPANPLKRRGLLLGAGVAGAAALVVKSLPSATTEVVSVAAQPVDASTGGYQVTPHVLRYYETTKI